VLEKQPGKPRSTGGREIGSFLLSALRYDTDQSLPLPQISPFISYQTAQNKLQKYKKES
jgi:hypothetical protein